MDETRGGQTGARMKFSVVRRAAVLVYELRVPCAGESYWVFRVSCFRARTGDGRRMSMGCNGRSWLVLVVGFVVTALAAAGTSS